MNDSTVAVNKLTNLKQKLDNAISSRANQEESFKSQSSLLIHFINKLSHVSKGVDLELDNRLAKLRTLLAKTAPFADIEQQIQIINKLLQQHTVTNQQNIQLIHQEFHSSGLSLQKSKGLPSNLRRELRELLNNAKDTKNALVQYNPLLNQLLTFYKTALAAKADSPSSELSTTPPIKGQSIAVETNATEQHDKKDGEQNISPKLLKKLSACLSNLNLSDKNAKTLSTLEKLLLNNTSNTNTFERFIEIFDVVIADLLQERDSAKDFLTSLSKTLSSVQINVRKTLATCNKSQKQQDVLNVKLQEQLVDMTDTVETALSLEQVKLDIDEKLQQISKTLTHKTKYEQISQKTLTAQLKDMSDKVKKLEAQSIIFEKHLKEQQIKSMQDALTKLNNRAAFDEFFAKELVKFHHQHFELAIVMLDLDDFKRINDTYGHSAGDKTLKVIANTLSKKLRKEVFIARYGGEEFVLIYRDTNKVTLVKELTDLKNEIARLPFKFKNNKVSITMSIGIHHINNDDNIHTAFEKADQALYQAKAKGKNQVVYFNN